MNFPTLLNHFRLLKKTTRLFSFTCAIWLALFFNTQFVSHPVYAQSANAPVINWSSLPAEQQKVLAPLKEQWSSMSPKEQQEWSFLSAYYKHLSKDEQTKLTIRIRDWASLPPNQRDAVKRNYEQATKQAPAADRAKIWEMYQTLQPVHKNSLVPN